MVTSIFDHVRGCETTECVYAKLEEINVKLFNKLIEPLEGASEDHRIYERADAACIILYILYAYSEKSDFLVLGADFAAEKVAIADRVNLPDVLREDVVEMLSKNVRDVIVDYINTQSNRAFRFLCFKKDMYEMAIAQGVRMMGSESFSIKDMQEHNKYINQLLIDITEYEDQLRSEYRYVYENKEEISVVESGKSKRDFGHIENSKYMG